MNPPGNEDQLRQAATILSLLGTELAERVRAGLSPDQRARLDAALAQAPEIPQEERAELVRSFTTVRDSAPQAPPAPAELKPRTAPTTRAAHRPPGEDTDRIPVVPAAPPSFAFITSENAQQAASCLAEEMPQIAALVVQRVPANVGRAILAHLPADLAADVAVALASDAPAPAPGALACIALELQGEVARLESRQQRRRQGVLTVAQVLAASKDAQAARVSLRNLAEKDEELAVSVAALLGLALEDEEAHEPLEVPVDEATQEHPEPPAVLRVVSGFTPGPAFQAVADG